MTTSLATAPDPETLGQRYLEALLRPDGRIARDLVEDALLAGVPAAEIYLQVVAPAMHEIGQLWETAQITVAQEHLATQISQAVIASLGDRLTGSGEPVGQGRAAVVAVTPGERHALGGQMVADFLETQGWAVHLLAPDPPVADLVSACERTGAELVALSTALPGHLLSVTLACQRLRQLPRPPFIVAGGRAYGGDPARAGAVGADAYADDPKTLLRLLADRFRD